MSLARRRIYPQWNTQMAALDGYNVLLKFLVDKCGSRLTSVVGLHLVSWFAAAICTKKRGWPPNSNSTSCPVLVQRVATPHNWRKS
jgi:hypothetical protein